MSITERIDKVTSIAPDYRGEVLPAPISVKVELTARCNYRCSFCARSQMLREQGDMDINLYERLCYEMVNAGVKELGVFYLGESFILPWLPDAIRIAKQAGFEYVFCTTNGSRCTPQKLRDAMLAGLDSLKFSFNYADADQLEAIAGVRGRYFERSKQAIVDARKIRDEGHYPCKLYASYIEYDGDQGAKMQRAVASIREYVDQVYALPLYNQASLVTAQEKSRGWNPTAGNRGRIGALRDPLPCWAVFTEGHVTFDGLLSACCFDHNDLLTMADLKVVSFMDGWNSLEFQALRRAHLAKDIIGTACERCIAYT